MGQTQPDEKYFSFKPMNDSSGIYYEKIAPVRFYNDEWQIVYHLNLSSLQDEFYELEKMVQSLTQLCEKVEVQFGFSDAAEYNIGDVHIFSRQFERQCNANFDQIKLSLEHVRDYNTHWFYSENDRRKKRAPFNVIGSVLRSLFGTLSQEDAEEYLNRFNFMETKNVERQVLMEQQTTLLRSTIEILKTMNDENKDVNRKVQNQFTTVNETITELREDFENLWLNLEFQAQIDNLLTFISLSISRYYYRQQQFLEAITFGSSAVSVTPIVLPPSLLLEELNYIQSQTSGKDISLPLPISREFVSQYYQIATTRSRIIQDQLIVAMSIPLVDVKLYDLVKATSMPTIVSESFYQFIVPTYEYIALDEFHESYVAMSNQELENCQDLRENGIDSTIICMQSSPIFNINSNREDCGVTLLTSKNLTSNCDTRLTKITSQLWLNLKEQNSWIGVFPTEQVLYIRCTDKSTFSRSIQGVGIVKFDQDCQIKTDQVLINAKKSYYSEIYERMIPRSSFNWTAELNISMATHNLGNMVRKIESPNVVSYGESDKLKQISTSISMLMERANSLESNVPVNKEIMYYRNPIWIGFTFLVLAAFLYVIMIVIYMVTEKGSQKIGKVKTAQPTEPENTNCTNGNETNV